MEITRGRLPHAVKCVVYGPEGIGKTTFASRFPRPVFIDTEGSTKELDVDRLPEPSSWQMVKDEVRYVIDHPECCGTLVIDTADWAEEMCCRHVCNKNQMDGLESFGYGKGYKYATEEFGTLINLLTDVVEKGVNVVVTAHAAMRKFEQPDEMGAYDRWEMKLINTQKCSDSAMLKEWADIVIFANYKTHTIAADKEGKKKKAMGAGTRVMYTTHHSCWDAKNRYGLPDEMDFDYAGIAHIIENAGRGTRERAKREEPAPNAEAVPEVPPKSHEAAPTEVPREAKDAGNDGAIPPEVVNVPGRPEPEPPDPRIPKVLRDLMIANKVCEWDIQNAVQERGFFPSDVEVRDYPEDFISDVLVAAWDQVFGVIKKRWKEMEELPFN